MGHSGTGLVRPLLPAPLLPLLVVMPTGASLRCSEQGRAWQGASGKRRRDRRRGELKGGTVVVRKARTLCQLLSCQKFNHGHKATATIRNMAAGGGATVDGPVCGAPFFASTSAKDPIDFPLAISKTSFTVMATTMTDGGGEGEGDGGCQTVWCSSDVQYNITISGLQPHSDVHMLAYC